MPLVPDIDSKIDQARRRFGIVGTSHVLTEALARAVRVSPIDLSVLVTGESGAGKEFFPKIIHAFGARKHNKYIAVNCGAIPEGTIDSELFGHEKGSFTGAVASRKGYFEEADKGTIFLDEVAELPLTTQARLLRVLETGEYLRVGSSVVQHTDVRIVAATNVDLAKAVTEGKFREDLFYRLSTVSIHVPNLHDRGADDIHLLARKFAADFSEKYMTPHITFTSDARRLMALYRWPGNVRQLKNVVDQAALFHAGEEIDAATLSGFLPRADAMSQLAPSKATPRSYESERELLWQTLVSMQNEIMNLRSRIDSGKADTDTFRPSDSQPKSTMLSTIVHRDNPAGASVMTTPYSDFSDISQTDTTTDRDAVADALRRHQGNRKKAAAELNISERTLYRKIKEYGL